MSPFIPFLAGAAILIGVATYQPEEPLPNQELPEECAGLTKPECVSLLTKEVYDKFMLPLLQQQQQKQLICVYTENFIVCNSERLL